MPLIRYRPWKGRGDTDEDELGSIATGLQDIIVLKMKFMLLPEVISISQHPAAWRYTFLKLRLDDKAKLTKTKQFVTSEETPSVLSINIRLLIRF